MNEKQIHLDWGFGLKWLVSCALGTAVFGLLAYGSMWTVGEAVGNLGSDLLGTMVAGLLFGAFFALGGTLGPGWLLQGAARKSLYRRQTISMPIISLRSMKSAAPLNMPGN